MFVYIQIIFYYKQSLNLITILLFNYNFSMYNNLFIYLFCKKIIYTIKIKFFHLNITHKFKTLIIINL